MNWNRLQILSRLVNLVILAEILWNLSDIVIKNEPKRGIGPQFSLRRLTQQLGHKNVCVRMAYLYPVVSAICLVIKSLNQ